MASAELGSRLSSVTARQRDWNEVLPALRDRLLQLWINPVVRSDAEACRIIAAMAECEDFAAIDKACDRLAARLRQVLGRADGTGPLSKKADSQIDELEFGPWASRSRIRV